MKTYGLYESAAVKVQTLKTAIEVGVGGIDRPSRYLLKVRTLIMVHGRPYLVIRTNRQSACMLLRIDDIVSSKKQQSDMPPPSMPEEGPE